MRKRICISIPQNLYNTLRKSADSNNRTISQEITYQLENKSTTTPTSITTSITTPILKTETVVKDTKEPSIKDRIKAYLDTFNIPPQDSISAKVYTDCKQLIEEEFFKRELRPDEINIMMFDEVQEERRKEYAKENNK